MKPTLTRFALAVAGSALAVILLLMALSGFHMSTHFWRVMLAELLAATVLGYAVWAAQAGGWRLVAAALLPMFVCRYFNTLDEGLVFIELPLGMVIGGMVFGLVNSALASAVLVWLMGKGRSAGPDAEAQTSRRSPGAWLWRFAAGSLAYLVLYFAAGLCVIPFTRDFYASFKLPSPGTIVLMEIFRGAVYIASVLPIVRMIPDRRHAAIALGLAFAILGGAVPLLPDNLIMPPHIRLAHTIEIGVSNFIFGVIVAYLFSTRSTPAPAPKLAERHAAAV